MSIWEFIGVLTLAILIFVCMLDTDWKRKLLRHHGEKNPYLSQRLALRRAGIQEPGI